MTPVDPLNEAFNRIKQAEEVGYIMSINTGGSGDDSIRNHCGIVESHAYSLLSAFTMTDAANTEH
jgi:hypothetical protein